MSQWFRNERINWIVETIRIYGFINREHVEMKFNVSTPQASADLGAAAKMKPEIFYNKSSKRYEYDPAYLVPGHARKPSP